MIWLLTALFCALLVELVLRLPFARALQRLQRSGARAAHVVTAHAVSDHWKERAMGAYALRTFLSSITLAALMAVVLVAAAVLVISFEQVVSGFEAFVLSRAGVGVSVAAAMLYAAARRAVLRG